MFKDKFRKAVEKYLSTISPSESNRAKSQIIKTVNAATNSDAREQIQQVLAEVELLPQWLENHFTPGSLFVDRCRTWGWWRDDQFQAEVIPIQLSLTGKRVLTVTDTRDGFIEAVPLPYINGREVSVPYQYAFTYAKYKFANACTLQWYRDEEGYKVERSIIPHGFWQAWKWWEGAWYWYMEKRPELFEDFDCWDDPEPDSRIEPGSAILGGKNKEFWESQKFYLK